MVCIMQTAAVASAFPSDPDEPDNTSRDFLGVGAGSILSGMVGSFAVDSSPPSTAIVRDSGGRSQIASLTAVALMIALAVLASGAMAYVPRAALAGILVYIAIKIFRVGEMINIARRGGREILLVVASAALVVVLPIESGMLLAIVLSFVHSLYIVARPYCAELARVPGTTVWWPPMPHDHSEHEDGVLVLAPAAPLNFTNVQDIVGRIRKAIATRRPPVKLLVIEASGIIDIDYTGSQLLRRAILELKKKGITVAIARLSHEQAQREAGRTGLVQSVGKDHVFMSVEEAVRKLGPGSGAGDFG
jgi:sulfate permease, SulP family